MRVISKLKNINSIDLMQINNIHMLQLIEVPHLDDLLIYNDE